MNRSESIPATTRGWSSSTGATRSRRETSCWAIASLDVTHDPSPNVAALLGTGHCSFYKKRQIKRNAKWNNPWFDGLFDNHFKTRHSCSYSSCDFMRGYLLISILCALFCVGFGDERNTNNAAASADPFSQKIDAEMVPDSLSVKCWGLREMAES